MRRTAIPFLVALAGCGTTVPTDLQGLADQPALAYSVLVTGGAFREVDAHGTPDGAARHWTFEATPDEAFPLEEVVTALRQGRVFTRVAIATDDQEARRHLAARRGDLDVGDPVVGRTLDFARRSGHDYVLVVQRLRDGPVEAYGINDRWPLTAVLWLVVGLGALIPDHTFESRATLHVALFEVHDGSLAFRTAEGAGPVDLSLVGRGSAWGLVQSIVVPPFWVGSDAERATARVRAAVVRRLLFAIARQLKSAASRSQLAELARATVVLEPQRDGLEIRVRSRDALSDVAVRVDGELLGGPAVAEFEDRLLGSRRRVQDGMAYAAELPQRPEGRYLQVMLQTVTGSVTSSTFDLRGD